MNKNLFLILLTPILGCYSQEASYEWSYNFGVASNEAEGKAIVTDTSGNVYITGFFEGSNVDFDPTAGTYYLSSNGSRDIFVQKIDQHSNLIWVKQIGGGLLDVGQTIELDSNGNVYTSGFFNGTVDFDPKAGVANLSASPLGTAFIQKLDTDGNFVWAKAYQDSGKSEIKGIAVDNNLQVYVTGCFSNSVDFDPGLGSFVLTTSGSTAIFCQKLDQNGDFVWAYSLDSPENDYAQGIALDTSENIYITGSFNETIDFDPSINTFNLTAAVNSSSFFVQKVDTDGNFVWARTMGPDSSASIGMSIDTDINGNVYTTGMYLDSIADFDPGVDTFYLTSQSYSTNSFVQKLDTDGNFLWIRGTSGSNECVGNNLFVNDSGAVFITGNFSGSTYFNWGHENINLSSNGYSDLFIEKINSAGTLEWVKSIGGTNVDEGSAITTSLDEEIYTTGFFGGTTDFDPNLGVENLTSIGLSDGFVMKMIHSLCVDTETEDIINACGDSYTWIDGITYVNNNNSATHHLTSLYGCDSLISLNLTLHPSYEENNYADLLWCEDGYTIGDTTYTVPGEYTDTLTTMYGCDSIVHTFLYMPKPVPLNTTLTLNGTTLTSNQSNVSYQWVDCNNGYTPIPGATAQSYTPTQSGSYAVKLTQDFFGCPYSGMSECRYVNVVGIQSTENTNFFSIYPNPINDFVAIASTNGQDIKNIHIKDLNGKLVPIKIQFNKGTYFIYLESVDAGVYFIEIETDNNVYNKRIIKRALLNIL